MMAIPENIEELTLEGLKELRKSLNELIIDREIALAVAKAENGGEGSKTQE